MDLETTLIDRRRCYGDGAAETIVGEAIRRGPRDEVILGRRLLPENASAKTHHRRLRAIPAAPAHRSLDGYCCIWRGSHR